MRELWRKHNFLITILGFLIAVGVVVKFAAIPYVQSIQVKSDGIQEKNIDDELDKIRLDKIPEMENQSKYLDENRAALESVMDSSREVDFIKQLELLAEKTNNKITLKINDDSGIDTKKVASQPKKDEEKGIIESLRHANFLKIDISLAGDYSGLVNFINKFENLPSYANIISIKSSKAEEARDFFSASLNNQANGMFSLPSAVPIVPASQVEPPKKEILNSLISVVVYTKK